MVNWCQGNMYQVDVTIASIVHSYACEVLYTGIHGSEGLMKMVNLIKDNLGKKEKINFMPMQPGDVPESFADIQKTTKMLGYKPTVNINEGIARFVEWFTSYTNHKM
jgi:UDP-glucuronate 4-epimerase